MYREILVPTDGNQQIERVVDEAVDLATLCEARVHVLHAIDESAYSSIPDEARDVVRDRLLEDGEGATRTVAERVLEADLEVVREVRWGPPPHAIVSYAVENEIDLIVMGTNGRTGYERYLLGSVAERVVRSAPMPVMTIDLDGHTDAVDVIKNGIENPPTPLSEGDDTVRIDPDVGPVPDTDPNYDEDEGTTDAGTDEDQPTEATAGGDDSEDDPDAEEDADSGSDTGTDAGTPPS